MCRAPKSAQLALVFKVSRHQFGVALLIKTADRFRVERSAAFSRRVRHALGKVRQRVQKNLDVLDVAHRALIIMHAFEIVIGLVDQGRDDDLCHVAEFFKVNPHAMDGGSLRPIHLSVILDGP